MIEVLHLSTANIAKSSPASFPDEGIDRGLRSPHSVVRHFSHNLEFSQTEIIKDIAHKKD